MTKALPTVLSLFAIATAYRMYDLIKTGLILPDEVRYIYSAAHSIVYGNEYVFGLSNIGIFQLGGIRGLDSFLFLMPVYLFVVFVLTALGFLAILKELGLSEWCLLLMLAALPVSVLDLGFLPSGLALALCMWGIWAVLKSKEGLRYVALSALLFALAAFSYPPYFVFLSLSAVLFMNKIRRLGAYLSVAAPSCALFVISYIGAKRPTLPCTTDCTHPSLLNVASIGHFMIVSLGLGWNVLAVPAAAGLVLCARRRNWTLIGISLVAVLSLGANAFSSPSQFYWNPALDSALFRYSQSTAPALLLLCAVALGSMGKDRMKAALSVALVATVAVGLVGLPLFTSQIIQYEGASPSIALRNFALSDPGQEICAVGYNVTSSFPGESILFVPYTWEWTPLSSYVHNVVFENSTALCPPTASVVKEPE